MVGERREGADPGVGERLDEIRDAVCVYLLSAPRLTEKDLDEIEALAMPVALEILRYEKPAPPAYSPFLLKSWRLPQSLANEDGACPGVRHLAIWPTGN